MPDKLVTVFDWGQMYGVATVDGVDAKEWIDVVVANYGHLKLISLSIMMFLLRVLIQPILDVYLLPDLQNQLYCIVR